MGGGGGGGTQVVPFNMAELAPFFPSVFNGPYNAQGAYQNAQTIAQDFPGRMLPNAGQFAGAQPGQFANPGGFPGSGVAGAPNPNPPIPPNFSPQMAGSMNPQAMGSNQVNGMDPTSLQMIMSVLGGQQGVPPQGQ